MGFLDFFRRKAASASQVSQALFPNGDVDVQRDVDKINAIFQGRLVFAKCQDFVVKSKALLYMSEDKSWSRILPSLRVYVGGEANDAELWLAYVYLAGEATYYDTISAHFRSIGKVSAIKEELEAGAAIYRQSVDLDQLPNGYGEFGLELTNPVLTISVSCTKEYLARLRFKGQPISARRAGSVKSPVSSGSVDVYEITCRDSQLNTIFVCPYHKRNSALAPRGFALSETPASEY